VNVLEYKQTGQAADKPLQMTARLTRPLQELNLSADINESKSIKHPIQEKSGLPVL